MTELDALLAACATVQSDSHAARSTKAMAAALAAWAPTVQARPAPAPAPSPTPTPNGPTPRYRYFAQDCWLYEPVADAAPLDWSPAFVAKLAASITSVNVNTGAWSPPVYHDPPGQPPVNLTDAQHSDGKRWHIDAAPIDPAKKCSPDSDRWLVHVSPDGSRSYEFVANATSHDLTQPYASGNIYDLVHGHGAFSGTSSGHGGSDISLLAGLIWKDELAAATSALLAGDRANADLGHALVCSWPFAFTRSMGWRGAPAVPNAAVFPAVTSDGAGDATAAPMGQRLRLAASLDVGALTLTPEQAVLLYTLQRWGFHTADSTSPGLLVFYAENTLTAGPYPAGLTGIGGSTAQAIVSHLEVVENVAPGTIDTPASFGGEPWYG